MKLGRLLRQMPHSTMLKYIYFNLRFFEVHFKINSLKLYVWFYKTGSELFFSLNGICHFIAEVLLKIH